MGVVVWLFAGQFDFERMVFMQKLGIVMAAVSVGILVYFVLTLMFSHEDLRTLKYVLSRDKILKK
jgi:putative peptidoglycan lipid II flippase